MSALLSAALCLLAGLVAYTIIHRSVRLRLPLPPGPRGLPLLGNALQVPSTYSWLTFAEWAKTYGKLIHLSMLGTPLIVLNTREAVLDLFEKRGAIYSDRPLFPMFGELGGQAEYIAFMPYTPRQREGRKLMAARINQRTAPALQAMQEMKVAELVSRLLRTPLEFPSHIQWHVASLVLRITHGLILDSCEHPIVQRIDKVMIDINALLAPGAYLVNSLPILMHVPDWFPGAGFKQVAREAKENISRLDDTLYNMVKEDVARGTAIPSFLSDFIQNNPNPTFEEEDLRKKVALNFYAGGSDTTVGTINNFLIIMAQHPDIQRKARAEVDAVTGSARLPRFSDRKDLPYLDATLKEVYRMNPIAPLGIPHSGLKQENEYEGYRIPAGSTIVANTWAIVHDPALYPNPHEVLPDRYLEQTDDDLNPDPRSFVFGYGRRVCPGQIVADDALFIVAATILTVFELSDAVSLDGSPIKYESGTACRPAPFKCTFTPRHTAVVAELMTD